MKEIPLTQGMVALIDDEDFYWISRNNWCVSAKNKGSNICYAKRSINPDGKKRLIRMHRVIMAAPIGVEVDHIDGNTLNNQKHNLRLCTPTQNKRNTRSKIGVSGFKGVHWFKPNKTWQARIKTGGKDTCLGYNKDPKILAERYDAEAIRRYGEFAKTNKSLGLL